MIYFSVSNHEGNLSIKYNSIGFSYNGKPAPMKPCFQYVRSSSTSEKQVGGLSRSHKHTTQEEQNPFVLLAYACVAGVFTTVMDVMLMRVLMLL